MPSLKISQLTTGSPSQGGDLVRVARFNGVDYDDWKYDIDDIKTYIDAIPVAQKGAANGVAPLNASSQVPAANLPYSAIAYQGTWNAATNNPPITSGVGVNGNFYWVTVAGNTNIDGISSWSVGNVIVFNTTTNKWEKGTMGTGTPGPSGANGNTVLNGTVAPTSGVGVNGDFYINTATNQIYGPKASGAWPAAVSLVGPAGPSGTVAQGKTRYVSNQLEFQQALAGFGTGIVSKIIMIQNIVLTASLELPKFPPGNRNILEIDLGGNTLTDGTATGLPYLIGRVPANQTEADAMIGANVALHLHNGTLQGNQNSTGDNQYITTQVLLNLNCTYNSVVERLNIYNSRDGIHFQFCLMCTIRNINAVSIQRTAIILDRGRWTGGTWINSQSNHTLCEQVRVYNRENAFAAFHIIGCSGIILRQCVSEGWPNIPQHHVYIDWDFATTVKDTTIEALHVESSSHTAGIKIVNVHEGYVQFKGLFAQYGQVLIDAANSGGYLRILIENMPWWPDTPNMNQLKTTTDVIWSFTNVVFKNLTNSRTPAYWVGALPFHWEEKGLNLSGSAYQGYPMHNATGLLLNGSPVRINNTNY